MLAHVATLARQPPATRPTDQLLVRLRALAGLIGDDDRIRLDRALTAATPEGSDQQRQASVRKFRAAVTAAAEAAGIDIELAVDSRRTAPEHRWCWFQGEDPIVADLEEMSAGESMKDRDPGDPWPVPPRVTELLPGTVRGAAASTPDVAVSPRIVIVAATRLDGPRQGRAEDFVRLLRRTIARGDTPPTVQATLEPFVGVSVEAGRDLLLAQADLVVILLSPEYLDDHREEARRIAAERLPYVPVQFTAAGRADLQGLDRGLAVLDKPFERLAQGAEQEAAVETVAVALRHRLEERLRSGVRWDVREDGWAEGGGVARQRGRHGAGPGGPSRRSTGSSRGRRAATRRPRDGARCSATSGWARPRPPGC